MENKEKINFIKNVRNMWGSSSKKLFKSNLHLATLKKNGSR